MGGRKSNRERIEREEAEIEQLLNKKPVEDKDEETLVPDNASPEEKTFAKRYGDLRRHSQQQQAALQKQIDELKEQLTKSTEQQIKLPKSEEELAEWAATYPDVAKIVETIAMKKAKEAAEAMQERLNKLDEREKLTAREKAELELMKIHPDFDKIRDTDDFHNWAEEQPEWVQKALYENDTDARSAARAIDLYKIDRNISKKKPAADTSAANSVSTRSGRTTPVDVDKEGVFLESEIAKMSVRQYEKMEEQILKARLAGKIVYDISAGAR